MTILCCTQLGVRVPMEWVFFILNVVIVLMQWGRCVEHYVIDLKRNLLDLNRNVIHPFVKLHNLVNVWSNCKSRWNSVHAFHCFKPSHQIMHVFNLAIEGIFEQWKPLFLKRFQWLESSHVLYQPLSLPLGPPTWNIHDIMVFLMWILLLLCLYIFGLSSVNYDCFAETDELFRCIAFGFSMFLIRIVITD